ncbi:hypothetical protein [Umezakia ovalisporum]|jgi:hypothetical protein|uniref:Uncharacterized protein n=2 Tax=Umezakia ovalisporum TaxID=75695 RepID=A0AA43KDV3_9CYAN|nr:hypothetical protein [Umezakia ovalisporum]MDH6056586.1 hypothetical protein [Umezakia ovalisporum FSS-43]MDH6062323.1 hypothetical protein [Umezakia ovalisporum FSS-62]MDH6067920.1 hypothetical protein [Umezakia ovalisporum APH033B]MDH6069246.1 hypothetical protein [Umezakia ovalisporum CobakiLakeA]MDH6073801.1 hypothetical protein [Umezakia ovalisporum CS-1034]
MTEGERLQRFKQFSHSSSRAMLQNCLFPIVNHEDGMGTLEILYPNEAVKQPSYRKKPKINNNISSCWSHIRWLSLCIEEDGKL